ncbi:cation:proton antiporter [Piscinibacter sp.]|uniref:cation:proton antiporter domain-containing protein n=1 Tax=Piscinibacter sp. TaxID=1903157 RepID=UPI002C281B93|nr:cation:proton antiporter [Albitalea sp.]HUG21820.1 cation:proton antiporter [Albitalea sp.]
MADIAAYLHFEHWPPLPDLLFWVALTLMVGALLGEAVYRGLALPRIVGYSAAGMAVAMAGFGFGDGQLQGNVRLIVDLALALLLFELGSRVSLQWLRRNPVLLWTSAAESLVSFAAMVVVLLWLGLDARVAVVCAALAVPASGAVIGRVSAELKSAGQVTERMIVLSALNTIYAVLALKLIVGVLHVGDRGDWIQGVAQPLYTFVGSVLVAVVLSQAVAWVMRNFELRDENSVLLLLGMILLAITAARLFALSTLLVPLLAGVMLRNASARPCIWPRHFGTAGGVLVLMLFVVLGSVWSVAGIGTGIVAALALLLARGLAKALVLAAAARAGGIETRQGLALALAMTPLSATALVLLADVQTTSPELAAQVAPIVLAAIAVMALTGPIFVQWGLRLTGEYQPMRRGAVVTERP